MNGFICGILAIPVLASIAAAQAGITTAIDDDLVVSTICSGVTHAPVIAPSTQAISRIEIALDTSMTTGGINGIQLRTDLADQIVESQRTDQFDPYELRVDGVYVIDPIGGGDFTHPGMYEEEDVPQLAISSVEGVADNDEIDPSLLCCWLRGCPGIDRRRSDPSTISGAAMIAAPAGFVPDPDVETLPDDYTGPTAEAQPEIR